MISDVGRWVGQRGSDVRCAIINEKETNQKELKKKYIEHFSVQEFIGIIRR
jgi:hypothetical protein